MTSTPSLRGGFPTALTTRQIEVLRELATGAPYKEIGRRLGCGESTVKGHVHVAYRKLGAGNRIDAFRVLGWLRVPA